MNNQDYLLSIGLKPTDEHWNVSQEALARYGEHRWWLSDDPKERAYYQFHEPRLLMIFSDFHRDIETLVGRAVWTHEFASSSGLLAQQVDAAWKQAKGNV